MFVGKKILLVDDEPLILKGLKYTLEQEGYETDSAMDGEEALSKFETNGFDLILLDVMLPKMDGISVCQRIRETSDVPIIMLTAKGEDMDKILGLEYGADDYMTKPFNILEVKARIKTILRRVGGSLNQQEQRVVRVHDMEVNLVKRSVILGGKDVKTYDLKVLRDAVAMVLQKNELFSGTIKDNLRWGNEQATDAEIEEACVLAQADPFIREMSDGYDTWIEQGGTNVSGGQKQRLCIARALLKKPKILILDDSTSAVDTKTDALIRAGFRSFIPETTKIIIAQRVSSVMDADLIVVLDDGHIAEMGTHEELLAQGGIYKEVHDSQTKGGDAA